MHAIQQHEFGPAENLRYERVADPVPGPGQVRIAVGAAGIHLLDTTIRKGVEGGPFPLPTLPMIPGREVAGVVDALGDGVAQRWLGTRVVAHLGQPSGGYAELALAPADALHRLPDDLADDAAVAMIGTGRTAMGILETAALTADDVLLVTAAAGGLGSLLVQAARSAGAIAVGAAGGPAKVDQVHRLGAHIAVDYTRPDWTDQVRAQLEDRTITVALDGVGGPIGRAALELLGVGGRLMMYGWSSGTPIPLTAMDLFSRGLTAGVAVGPKLLRRPGGLRDLETRALEAAATGRLTPLIANPFPLAAAAEAHTALETRATMGKVILKP
ncbi:MAG TPA: zinc-binding dehydrogenase [Actinophytocola sp.]|uniref:zinc-binding dehydrogenase n=1 Tax=Actinophytocola sp. TaxID=1872138 RepID=UPI002DBB3BED|nr:zinc-binding dehydrogenase [Actinophytocola sp.]HEU5475384.1 zinc-binding dehydrogenase [Actinophytocola sp.]